MKIITLVTGNNRKVNEARAACDKLGIRVQQVELSIDEIQSSDPKKICKHKAEAAYAIIQKPVVVTDTFWNIPALNGFPGAYMKEVAEWLKPEDFLNLLKDKDDRRIAFTESITYKDDSQTKIFTKEFWGVIANEPRGTGNTIEQIAEFNGFTIGERRDEGGLSHRPEDYIWFDFAKWFSEQKD